MISVQSDSRLETLSRDVSVEGLRPIMFDRYAGDNDTRLSWSEKIYLVPGTNVLALPIANINSFFTAQNTKSAPKLLRDKRKYKDLCNALQSYLMITSPNDTEYIPFLRDGKEIEVGDFEEGVEPKSGIVMHRSVARLDKGIPNPKERPMLPLPWALNFKIELVANSAVKESEVRNLLIEGGIALGFGTYRGVFGKFSVTRWE